MYQVWLGGHPAQGERTATAVPSLFKMKLDELIKDIDQRKIFGKVAAQIHVVEFQKRGLPHVHILLILEEKIVNVDQVEAPKHTHVSEPESGS